MARSFHITTDCRDFASSDERVDAKKACWLMNSSPRASFLMGCYNQPYSIMLSRFQRCSVLLHLTLLREQGAMTQCRKALKPDGLFLANMWGGNTLQVERPAPNLVAYFAF